MGSRRLHFPRDSIFARAAVAGHLNDSVLQAASENDVAITVFGRVRTYRLHGLAILAGGVIAVEKFPM